MLHGWIEWQTIGTELILRRRSGEGNVWCLIESGLGIIAWAESGEKKHIRLRRVTAFNVDARSRDVDLMSLPEFIFKEKFLSSDYSQSWALCSGQIGTASTKRFLWCWSFLYSPAVIKAWSHSYSVKYHSLLQGTEGFRFILRIHLGFNYNNTKNNNNV